MFTLNDVFNPFHRSNENLLTTPPTSDAIPKVTRKNIIGISYRYMPNANMNLTVFGKQYHQYVSGPMATSLHRIITKGSLAQSTIGGTGQPGRS